MKIDIISAELQTQLFIIVFAVALLFTIRKRQSINFDIGITNELKGLAILMVIFSHIGYFLVTDNRFLFPLSVGGGIGVNLFFFLSGYGLSVSAIKKNLSILDFYKKRVIKLFLPLWTILPVILFLDYFLLSRSYPFTETWQAFLGYFSVANLFYNIDSPLWFITLITFYYLLFPIIFNKKYLSISAILLIVGSYFLLTNNFINKFLIENNIFSPGVLSLYRTHYFAFPMGLIMADLITNKAILQKIWNYFADYFSKHKIFTLVICYCSLLIALYIGCYTAIYSGIGKGEFMEQLLSLVTCSAIIFFFIFNKIKFGLFSLIGMYSYEIYLIHWPILARFDIFYKFLPPFLATIFYIGLFIILGFIFNKLVNIIATKIFRIV